MAMKIAILKNNPILIVGLCGLLVTLLLQLGFVLAGIPGAADAWLIWGSCYAAWIPFAVIGIARRKKNN
jgi:uncharacterized protein YaaW (UPF0174 family)